MSTPPPPSPGTTLTNRGRRRRRQLEREEVCSSSSYWKFEKVTEPSSAEKEMFLTMHIRKVNRQLTGKRKEHKWRGSLLLVFMFLLIAVGVSSSGSSGGSSSSKNEVELKLNVAEIRYICLWFAGICIVTSVFTDTKFLLLLYWVFIYEPLGAILILLLFYNTTSFDEEEGAQWIWACWIVIETVTIFVFVMNHYVYPTIIRSNWFRTMATAVTTNTTTNNHPPFMVQFWRMVAISNNNNQHEWTIMYDRKGYLGRIWKHHWRHTCKFSITKTIPSNNTDTTTTTRGQNNNDTTTTNTTYSCWGKWYDDDSQNGEILIGYFHHSKQPMAPYLSRLYRNGDTIRAVRIGYFVATDDVFTYNRFFPTNTATQQQQQPPTTTIGVASVECSIYGNFYNHYPLATPLLGPWSTTTKKGITNCLQSLLHLSTLATDSNDDIQKVHNNHNHNHNHTTSSSSSSPHVQSVSIQTCNVTTTNDTTCQQGIQVTGHIYQPTGLPYSNQTQQIIIHVVYPHDKHTSTSNTDANTNGLSDDDNDEKDTTEVGFIQDSKFMPFPSSYDDSDVLVLQQQQQQQQQQTIPEEEAQQNKNDNDNDNDTDNDNENENDPNPTHRKRNKETKASPYFQVQDWIPMKEDDHHPFHSTTTTTRQNLPTTTTASDTVVEKDVLIYIPGYNTCMKNSCETLGQFIAMTQVTSWMYPIIYCWPNGQALSYPYASKLAASPQNQQNLYHLLQGLQQQQTTTKNKNGTTTTGNGRIQNIHFMTHSMGVQSLLNAFYNHDKDNDTTENHPSPRPKTKTRTPLSKLFQLQPEFEKDFVEEKDEKKDNLLICKSIILLNPDFPIKAFVNHAFYSIRCICNHITIVGDHCDQALYYSERVNGLFNYLSFHEQPNLLKAKPPQEENNPQEGNNNGGGSSSSSSRDKKQRRFEIQHVLGRSMELLYIPGSIYSRSNQHHHDEEMGRQQQPTDPNRRNIDERLVWKGMPQSIVMGGTSERFPATTTTTTTTAAAEEEEQKNWLDVDVIDTTRIDTNIASLRHNCFTMNPILLKDLEELLTTGRRASKRSSLLYRSGNTYSYCHAPSFVAM